MLEFAEKDKSGKTFKTGEEMKKTRFLLPVLIASAMALTACASGTPTAPAGLSGQIVIDGSSTVFPITEAMSEEFTKTNPNVKVPVGFAGTGGGFKKLIAGEIDINDASRPIKPEEADALKAAGRDALELKIGYDGLTVVVNKKNDWCTDITVEELAKIWGPDSTVKLWSDVRPEWPAEKINLYGPGTDSGTFDYFTEVVNGKTGAIRTDYTPSEDDNVLVAGVAGDLYAMGFFGFAYFEENADKLNDLSINGVKPSVETIKGGTYKPLSRPLFITWIKKPW
jgi:phosphate transport system substrate-binding protein